jgi:cytochrome c oxidase cbb3-type subunit I/II
MKDPRSTTPGSIMPRYPHILANPYDVASIGPKLRALRTVGVPYTDGEIDSAPASIAAQAKTIAAEVEAQRGPKGLEDREITALIAYLQRLGTDIKWKRVAPQAPLAPVAMAAPAIAAAPAPAAVAAK